MLTQTLNAVALGGGNWRLVGATGNTLLSCPPNASEEGRCLDLQALWAAQEVFPPGSFAAQKSA